jgi:hypothetical protein
LDLSRFLGPRPPAKTPAAEAAEDPRALRGESDAIATSVANFLSRTGLFDREAYLRAYPDVLKSGLDPLHHFVRVGIHAGRTFTSLETIARLWREVLRARSDEAPPTPTLADPSRHRVAIYVSSLGNFFMTEIAEVLKAGFTDAAVAAELRDENGAPAREATHHIVIAPHEFFTLGEGRRWANDDFVSRAVLFSTEQLQTQWFARSLVFLTRARAVADMNEQNAAILRKAGIRALAVQPGYSPSFAPFASQRLDASSPVFAALPPAARAVDVNSSRLADRPLDVLFLGTHSPRRDKFLAGYAKTFAELNAFIYYSKAWRPLTAKANPMAASQVTAALLQRAKILLNLHRDEYTYFEWWRLMQAFWHKTVVVTEACFPHRIFKPGVHYFEEAPRHMHHLIAWLARTPDGQAKANEMRERAHRDLIAHANARTAALALLAAGEAA